MLCSFLDYFSCNLDEHISSGIFSEEILYISKSQVCDGVSDCPNNRDEETYACVQHCLLGNTKPSVSTN